MNVSGVALGRLRQARNTWFHRGRRGHGRRGGHPAVGLVLAIVLALLIGFSLSALFGVLAANGANVHESANVLALVLSAALAGLLIFDVHHAVASILVDSDVDLLRRAPLSARAMLGIKLADSLPRTSALLVVLAIPAILAFIDRYPLPAWGLVALPLQLAAFWAIPLGIGMAIALGLLRVVPPRRAREALGLLSTMTLVVLWLANSFLLPRLVESGETIAIAMRDGLHVSPLAASLSPGHALALAVSAAGGQRAPMALAWTAWLFAAATVSLALAAWAVTKNAALLQGTLSVAAARARDPGDARERARSDAPRRGVVRAIVRRDILLFRRDWTVLGDVLTAGLLWTLLPLLSGSVIDATPAMMVRAMLVALTVGLGYEIAARSVPFERKALAWARLAPVPPLRWAIAKFSACAVLAAPFLAMAGGALVLTIPLPPRDWLATLSTAASAMGTALVLGLWTGARFGDPEWTNPRAMLTLSGRIVASALLLAQGAGWLLLSMYLWNPGASGRGSADLWLPPIISTTLIFLFILAVGRRLTNRGWSY